MKLNTPIKPELTAARLTVDTPDWTDNIQAAKTGSLSSQFHCQAIMQTFAFNALVEIVDTPGDDTKNSELVANNSTVDRVSDALQSLYIFPITYLLLKLVTPY